ncbi:hypothetical protein OAK15_04095, partial [Verrucomicrobia bacterium]|nr:hypothetical protein [Verrucomicrobiota bacterium]
LAKADGVGLAVEHAQVQREEHQHRADKPNPAHRGDGQCGFVSGGEYHAGYLGGVALGQARCTLGAGK